MQVCRKVVAVGCAVVVLVLILLLGCTQEGLRTSENLEGTWIREYEGEKLSSPEDFRENSIKGPQYIDRENYRLRVSGVVDSPQEYTYDEIVDRFKNYEKVVRLDCVEGWSVTILWRGVLVRDILAEAKPGESAKAVIFHAEDGDTTAFPLTYFEENDIIMAYEMNNVTLPPERGFPFQLVAESKWGYKWIKWITEIEVTDDEDYLGYWESRGYAKEGNLNESFIG